MQKARIEEILEVLHAQPAGPRSHRKYFTRSEARWFVIPSMSAVLAVLVGLVNKFSLISRDAAILVSSLLLLFAQVVYLIRVVWMIRSALKEVWPDSRIPQVRINVIQLDSQRLQQLHAFTNEELRYVAERLQLEAEHMRSRLGLLLGTIDKVGIIPLIVGSAYGVWKLVHEASLSLTGVMAVLAGLTLFYLVGMVVFIKGHRLDELAQVANFAASENGKVEQV